MNALYYDCIESPMGSISLEANDWGLTKIYFTDDKKASILKNEYTDSAIEELQDYFYKKIHRFETAIDPQLGTDFQKKVWQELRKISFGRTMIYSDFTSSFTDPKAVRAVSHAIALNPIMILIPCHRVLGKNNKITGYAGGVERKAALLHFENPMTYLF